MLPPYPITAALGESGLRIPQAVAVGHTILVIAYHLLQGDAVYQDLGPGSFDQRDQHRLERRLTARLQGLGYKVTLEPLATAA